MNPERLMKTLAILERLYTRLAQTAQRKRDALVAFSLPEVERSVERENELIARVRRVDRLRAAETGDATLGTLADRLGENGQPLHEMRARLLGLATGLSRLNRLNAQLCRQGLEHVQGFLELITKGSPEQNVYGKRGNAREFAARSLLNQSA